MKFSPGCGCCSGATAVGSICVKVHSCVLSLSYPVYGASVTVQDGSGTVIGTGTTQPSGGVSAIAVSSNGTGYTIGDTLTVSIAGGGGSGATATASVTAPFGQIVVTVTNQGSGYTSLPTVTLSGGHGTGAKAYASAFTPDAQACINIFASGTYTVVVLQTGYATSTTTVTAGTGTTNTTVNLTVPSTLTASYTGGSTSIATNGTQTANLTCTNASAILAIAGVTCPGGAGSTPDSTCTPTLGSATVNFKLTFQCGSGLSQVTFLSNWVPPGQSPNCQVRSANYPRSVGYTPNNSCDSPLQPALGGTLVSHSLSVFNQAWNFAGAGVIPNPNYTGNVTVSL